MKVLGPAGLSPHMKQVLYVEKKIDEKYGSVFTKPRSRKPVKREALLMIERRTGKKVGTI
ncbi:MAG TPA: hypothetical protein H9948_01545 [Candidatus Jeotgalibaca merdavium]|jgi:hypothetical protein|uniref:Uncharacterized protein n=1 Tax=Candidatus Jeotgalibaca merdavium TaxID=2838627 RepID=A0A9D2I0Q0_9LACT|nr:hypothetical protein [Candidatus Jeotgalibaca merdavium]